LALRATRGFQQLLNRTAIGTTLRSDLQILPASSPAADTGTGSTVPYPVLGVVRPRLEAGPLRVNITMYLYPLKER
jgi:hypothetical protein